MLSPSGGAPAAADHRTNHEPAVVRRDDTPDVTVPDHVRPPGVPLHQRHARAHQPLRQYLGKYSPGA